jgi:hypothetical protein
MGDSEAPDISKLPDASDILSHLAFVHRKSVQQGAGELALARPFIRKIDGRFRVGRELLRVPFLPETLLGVLLPYETGCADLMLHTDFYNISLLNSSGPWMWRTNADGSRGESLGMFNFVHCITPETEYSTHYFGVLTRNFRIDDDELSDMLVRQNDNVRGEDRVMLEAIEQRGAYYGDPTREVSVFSDAGALRVRRMIQALFETEARKP